MAEKDYEGQEESSGGGKPNIANIASLPVIGAKAAKKVKGIKRAVKAVRHAKPKAASKGRSARYRSPRRGRG